MAQMLDTQPTACKLSGLPSVRAQAPPTVCARVMPGASKPDATSETKASALSFLANNALTESADARGESVTRKVRAGAAAKTKAAKMNKATLVRRTNP